MTAQFQHPCWFLFTCQEEKLASNSRNHFFIYIFVYCQLHYYLILNIFMSINVCFNIYCSQRIGVLRTLWAIDNVMLGIVIKCRPKNSIISIIALPSLKIIHFLCRCFYCYILCIPYFLRCSLYLKLTIHPNLGKDFEPYIFDQIFFEDSEAFLVDNFIITLCVRRAAFIEIRVSSRVEW